ncbi:MAG: hypothetical protein H8E41_10605 [Desulfobulbaceae bacterium]|uniref:Tryptophan synthase subunit beta like protein n=1 Tax=Candidatus Desulfobia pelagia TaxID=2841692 RepID=A0A8J6NF89_9BACT|nr:hypothetical protein [Candidatus Desulfobia pelagia]
MLYIERDQDGEITGLRNNPSAQANEKKPVTDAEVLSFLNKKVGDESFLHLLSLSDVGIIRILEDLVELLIKKNILLLTELPEEAQDKIKQRKMLRDKMYNQDIMVEDIL